MIIVYYNLIACFAIKNSYDVMHRIPHLHVWNPDVRANSAIYSNSELRYSRFTGSQFAKYSHPLFRTLSCSPSVTVCSCVGLGLGNRVRVRNRV